MRGLDLHIEPGERVLLLGPSGSGKSTLLAGLAGLLDPGDAGEVEGAVRLDGVTAARARARAGLVLQDPEAALVMARAGDDVAFGLENRGVPTDEIWRRVDEALEAVGFPYGRDAATSTLSGGEQQRLALAGILALRPGLLLLDEVTANLDPAGVALVRGVLADVLASTGATAVIVEHRVETVVDLCSRAVVLSGEGTVVADGTPDVIFAREGDALAGRGVWVPGHRPAVAAFDLSTLRDEDRDLSTPGGQRPVLSTHRDEDQELIAVGDKDRELIAVGAQHRSALMTAAGVSFRYPDAAVHALSATDVRLRAGEALAVTGANGSGKSTLALCLAGLLRPTGGTVTAEPALAPPSAEPPWRWRGRDLVTRIGTVFQDPEHQFVAATVRAELMVGPVQAGAGEQAAAARADELMERLGLTALAAASPFTLSGGEKRRLSVATAIATAPRVLVTDEPTYGQDAVTWAGLVELLAGLRAEGTAVVLVTHDEPLVEMLADVRLRLPVRAGSGAA